MNLSEKNRAIIENRLTELENVAALDTPPMRVLAQLWLFGLIRDIQPLIDGLAFTQPENFEIGKRIEALYARLT